MRSVANPGFAGLEPSDVARQTRSWISFTESRTTDIGVDERDRYRPPLTCETSAYELTGYAPTGHGGRFASGDLVEPDPARAGRLRLRFAEDVAFHAVADKPFSRRLTGRRRTLWRSDDLAAMAPLGTLPRHGIAGESYALAFTPDLLQTLRRTNAGGPPEDLIPDATGLLGGDGGYVAGDAQKAAGLFSGADPAGLWWQPSGRTFLSPEATDSAAAELAYARSHFFLPCRFVDPFGETTTVRYDDGPSPATRNNLLAVSHRDAVGNQTFAVNDYRVLLPVEVTDPNGNRTAVRYDALGLMAGTAVMGKPAPAAAEGDSLTGFRTDPDPPEVRAVFDAADPRPAAAALLGAATTRILYDLASVPACAATISRETHVSDLSADEATALQLTFVYSDGLGRETGRKMPAEPGPVPKRGVDGRIVLGAEGTPEMAPGTADPRWVGNGWTVTNNKGEPVRQYEPFFTDTHKREPDLRVGVSPTLFYDPLGRPVGTLHPDHTWEKVVFSPWRRDVHDSSDTLLPPPGGASPADDPDIGDYLARLPEADYLPTWHALRTDPASAAAFAARYPDSRDRTSEAEAAADAARHASTPTITHFDALGRAFLTVSDNGADPATPAGPHRLIAGRVELDIGGAMGSVRDGVTETRDAAGAVTADPLGRIVAEYRYDMLGRCLHLVSMEAGERWALADATDAPLRAWDSRGHTISHHYDPLRRLLRSTVAGLDPADPARELLTGRIVYGEQHPDAAARNLRGRTYMQLDGSGVVTTESCDFKGIATAATRRITGSTRYRGPVDWRAVDEDHAALPSAATEALDPAKLQAALAPFLASETYASRFWHDALGRPIQVLAPHEDAATAHRNVIRPRYNAAGLVDRISTWLQHDDDPGALLDPATASLLAVRDIDYDAEGRRTRIEYGAGAGPGRSGVTAAFSYDAISRRLASIRTERDAAAFPDDRAAPAGWPGAALQNLHYTYDAAGNVTHIRDDAQQTIYFRNRRVEPSARYSYDALHRLTETKGREHLGQSAAGRVSLPHSYNDAGRVGLGGGVSFSPSDGVAMAPYTERYDYDAANNITEMRHIGGDAANPGWTRSYLYTEPSRIEDGAAGLPLKSSNRLSATRIGEGPLQAHSYDAHGSMLAMPQLQVLAWDHLDQLSMTQRQRVGADDADGDEHQGERTYYVYDAAGARVRKVTEKPDANLKDERLYLSGFEIYRRHSGQHAGLVRDTLHLVDGEERFAMVETRNAVDDGTPQELVRYQFSNHIGSASLELDGAAKIISYEEYAPYGSTTFQAVRGQTETKRYRFTGKERDQETGLEYHGLRYYAPWLGRWTSCDPAGLVDGANLYAYAAGNPVDLVRYRGNEVPGQPQRSARAGLREEAEPGPWQADRLGAQARLAQLLSGAGVWKGRRRGRYPEAAGLAGQGRHRRRAGRNRQGHRSDGPAGRPGRDQRHEPAGHPNRRSRWHGR